MGDLSRNFSSAEFTCRCGCGVLKVDPLLIDSLQQLRDNLDLPIRISSGYRCPKYNKLLGGAINSFHVTGQAADIVIPKLTIQAIFAALYNIPAFQGGGIGLYPNRGFTHVDVRGYAARWAFIGKKLVSINEALRSV